MTKRYAAYDEDADLDQVLAGQHQMAGGGDAPESPRKVPQWVTDGANDPCTAPKVATTFQERVRATQGRRLKNGNGPGPDSSAGLALYFADKCPPISWDGSLEFGNYTALVKLMSTLRFDHELSADDIRALVDLYFARLNGRRPRSAYMWDFKRCYHQLIDALHATGTAVTEDAYRSWTTQPQATDEERAAYLPWGSA